MSRPKPSWIGRVVLGPKAQFVEIIDEWKISQRKGFDRPLPHYLAVMENADLAILLKYKDQWLYCVSPRHREWRSR